jgi:hypothetical protein
MFKKPLKNKGVMRTDGKAMPPVKKGGKTAVKTPSRKPAKKGK